MKGLVKYSLLFAILIVGCKSKEEKILGDWRIVKENGDSTNLYTNIIFSFKENHICKTKKDNFDGTYENSSIEEGEGYWQYLPKSNSILLINNLQKDSFFLTEVSINEDYLTFFADGAQMGLKKITSNEKQKSEDLDSPKSKIEKLEKAVLSSVRKKYKEDGKENLIKSLQLVQKSDKEYIGIIEVFNGYSTISSKIEVIGNLDKFIWQIKD